MRCNAVLGKSPFVLTPFTNFTINESLEIVAKVIVTAQ
jgi:hypothetical protein